MPNIPYQPEEITDELRRLQEDFEGFQEEINRLVEQQYRILPCTPVVLSSRNTRISEPLAKQLIVKDFDSAQLVVIYNHNGNVADTFDPIYKITITDTAWYFKSLTYEWHYPRLPGYRMITRDFS